ncbi:class I SAM-dependent methyltransferase [Luteococcus sediminum]
MTPTNQPLTRDDLSGGFDEASTHYDLMVALNPGYRRHLRAAAEALLDGIDDPLPTLLDLGCGSGLSTRALLRAARRRGITPRIIGVDASAGMLARARSRRWPEGVTFVHGRGERLEDLGLPPAHGALTCYLLRNVTDLDATLVGIQAALLPDGVLVAEDYSVRGSVAARRRWGLVNRHIILPLAGIITGDRSLYEYLHGSVDDFCTMPELAEHLHRAGFHDVASRTVGGWQRDILHLVRARA